MWYCITRCILTGYLVDTHWRKYKSWHLAMSVFFIFFVCHDFCLFDSHYRSNRLLLSSCSVVMITPIIMNTSCIRNCNKREYQILRIKSNQSIIYLIEQVIWVYIYIIYMKTKAFKWIQMFFWSSIAQYVVQSLCMNGSMKLFQP